MEKLKTAILQFVGCGVIVACLGFSALAASIEGEEFIVKPWLPATIFYKDNTKFAIVELGFEIENPSVSAVRIRGMHLKWEVYGINTTYVKFGIIRLEQSGAPPFDEIFIWPHASNVHSISDMITKPVFLRLPKGRYGYVISLVDPGDNIDDTRDDEIVLSSTLPFEVR